MALRLVGLVWALLAACPTLLDAQQQTGTVRGRVLEAGSNAPVPDAQVVVDGTRLGAMSRADGGYTIAGVPAGSRTLVVRRIGYAALRRAVTVAAGETVDADLVVERAVTSLREVVVTGSAAPTERRAVGTSVASVDSGALQRAQAVTIDQALQGKIAGAQIQQNSGNPGGGGVSVRLRGTSSFISGSDPLYIVDGVIVDNSSAQLRDLGTRGNVQNRLADINPADIERIEVIRGAAAAALYGSRANNGVVQIFTKRGRAGRARFTLNTRYSSNELRRELGTNQYPFNALGAPVQRFDYQDEIFRRGYVSENNLSVEGGSEGTKYYVNGSWTQEEGIVRATDNARRGGRINLTQQLSPRVFLDVGANFVNNRSNFLPQGEGAGVLTAFLFNQTSSNLFPVDGVYPNATIVNPLLAIDRFRYPQEVNRFIGNTRVRWTPTAKLSLDYNLGYDGYQQEGGEFIPRGAFPTGTLANGFAANTVRESRIINQDAVATLTTTPLRDWSFGSTVGFNHTAQQIDATTAAAFDLGPLGELVSAGATPAASQSRVELITVGFYGQQTAAWRDRLFLTGALRMDASSTFGPEERWQLFPKASVSYVLSEEGWFADGALGRLMSSARLRAALGYAGNQPSVLNAYSRFDEYASTTFDGKPGLVNNITLGNPRLRPERQREVEYGADLSFLRDRIALEATYYDKLVSGLLFFRPVSPSTGFSRQFSDIGSMSNRGIELLLRTTNVERPGFRWQSTATYTRNRNRVEELTVPDFQSASGYPNRIRAGDPVGVFYGAYAARDCRTGAFLLDSLGRLRPSNSLPAATAAREALSGGSCNNENLAVLGDPNPDWLGSLLNEMQIGRNLNVRVLLDGSFGNDVMNLSRRIQDIFGTGSESARELLPVGDPNRLPAGYLARQGGIFGQYVEDGTYVKLREVAATYTLRSGFVRRAFPEGIDLTLAGRNLAVWTDYSGYDPEVNLFGQTPERAGQTAADRGFDFASYPIPRTWSLSARFTY